MADDGVRRRPPAAWWYGALAGALAATAMTLEALTIAHYEVGLTLPAAAVILGTAAAVGLYRIQPGLGLALVWGVGALQVVSATEVLAGQLTVAMLAYGIGRYGSRMVLVAAALSILLAVPSAIWLIVNGYAQDPPLHLNLSPWLENGVAIGGLGGLTWTALPALSSPLVVPALVGIALRMWDRSRRSVAAMEAAQNEQAAARERELRAQELAHLREGQARLARDVHDVVGHSLTVILAQAQSAQYLDRDLNPDVARALAAISDTARSSLADVRSILTSTQERGPAGTSAGAVSPDFERMIDDVRAAGALLQVDTRGEVRPLPPDQAVTLYRVLQEMLTNVLKHGAPGHDVAVTFDWRSALVVHVANEVPHDSAPPVGTRHGLTGMRERMAAVGGTLDSERAGTTFTVTATFPHAGERPNSSAVAEGSVP